METIESLLEYLSHFPPDTKIHMASDAEGNAIYELDEISEDEPLDGEPKTVTLWPRRRVSV